jgi:hypothetical protein
MANSPARELETHIMLCANCKTKMRLVGLEWDTERSDLYTFACDACHAIEVKAVEAA